MWLVQEVRKVRVMNIAMVAKVAPDALVALVARVAPDALVALDVMSSNCIAADFVIAFAIAFAAAFAIAFAITIAIDWMNVGMRFIVWV